MRVPGVTIKLKVSGSATTEMEADMKATGRIMSMRDKV